MTEQGVCPTEDEMDAEEEITKRQITITDLLTALEHCEPAIAKLLASRSQAAKIQARLAGAAAREAIKRAKERADHV